MLPREARVLFRKTPLAVGSRSALRRFWEKLPADIRAALEGAVPAATRFANDAAKKENDDALAAMKWQGRTTVTTLSPEEIAARICGSLVDVDEFAVIRNEPLVAQGIGLALSTCCPGVAIVG